MAKNHGARQQKRLAKKKAKQSVKRSIQLRRSSSDPTIRLLSAEKWPIVQSLVADTLWEEGIGHLLIARKESHGRISLAVFLVDVYCLGVKNVFWLSGFQGDLEDVIHRLEVVRKLRSIAPECLVRIVKGAVDYAGGYGFTPHPDYRLALMLLAGIDESECGHDYQFGRDGKPFYIQGPNESLMEAQAIARRVTEAGGHFMAVVGTTRLERSLELDDFDEPDDD